MKLQTEIGGNTYTFQLTRNTYKMLLADKEYAKLQNELVNKLDNGETEESIAKGDMTGALLNNLIFVEKVFYYGLKANHPTMTMEEADRLIDIIFEEDGSMEFVNEIAQELVSSFTQGANDKTERKARVLTKI